MRSYAFTKRSKAPRSGDFFGGNARATAAGVELRRLTLGGVAGVTIRSLPVAVLGRTKDEGRRAKCEGRSGPRLAAIVNRQSEMVWGRGKGGWAGAAGVVCRSAKDEGRSASRLVAIVNRQSSVGGARGGGGVGRGALPGGQLPFFAICSAMSWRVSLAACWSLPMT